MRFEFNVGDLVTFKTKNDYIGVSMHEWRKQNLKTKEITAIVISKRYYQYNADQNFGTWFYTIYGSDGRTYRDCKGEQLKILANWVKPEKINH